MEQLPIYEPPKDKYEVFDEICDRHLAGELSIDQVRAAYAELVNDEEVQ